MMLIKKIKLEHARNDAHFQFQTEFGTLVKRIGGKPLNIEVLFKQWELLYKQEEAALVFVKASDFTRKRDEADRQRDRTLRGLIAEAKNARNHFHPGKVDAAYKLKPLLDLYKTTAKKPLDEETTAIQSLLNELRSERYFAHAQSVGLEDWMEQLETDNQHFSTFTTDRISEIAGSSTARMKPAREEIDACYRAIIKRIEALVLINGAAAHSKFIPELNVSIDHYNNIIAQEIAMRSATQPKKEK